MKVCSAYAMISYFVWVKSWKETVTVFTIIYYYYYDYFNNSEMQISTWLVEILTWAPKISYIFSILIPDMEKQISR